MPQQVKKTVLIVEDNPLNMKLESDLLEINGFLVLRATCGKEALDILRGSVPDIILLDVRLPDINGCELFKKIKQDARFDAVKIVAVTASVTKEEEEEIKKSGFDGFIAKPIRIKDFIQQIKEKLA
ncbi:MAG: response regulator [Candidatus Omnitrophota bacterium]|jgi:two-component system cell cycle response regulator DivK